MVELKFNKKDIGQSKLREEPKKRFFFKLAPGCITPEHFSAAVKEEWLQPVLDDLFSGISGRLDFGNYYTKEEVDSLFPEGEWGKSIDWVSGNSTYLDKVITLFDQYTNLSRFLQTVGTSNATSFEFTKPVLLTNGAHIVGKTVFEGDTDFKYPPTFGSLTFSTTDVIHFEDSRKSLKNLLDDMTNNMGTVRGILFNKNYYSPTGGVITIESEGITTETDPVFSASVAASIKQTDVNNWNSKTDNTGTLSAIRCGAYKVVEAHDGFLETSEFLPNIKLNGTEYGITQDAAGNNIYDLGILTTGEDGNVVDGNYVHTDNNFTNALKTKLDGIAAGAEVNVQSDWNVTNSNSDAYIKNKPTIPTVPSNVSAFTNDAGYLTEHQSLGDYATKEYVDSQIQSAVAGASGTWVLSTIHLKNGYSGRASSVGETASYQDCVAMCVTNAVSGSKYLITTNGHERGLPILGLIADNGILWSALEAMAFNDEHSEYTPEAIVADFDLAGIQNYADFSYLITGVTEAQNTQQETEE